MSASRSISRRLSLAAALLLAGAAQAALAETIKVGVSISTTGPAASLGVPQRNSIALMPKTIAGQDIEYIVLDDGADASRAVANMRKLIDENRVDVVIGSSTTPASLAMVDVAAEKKIPMVSLAASVRIIAPMDAARAWVFKTPQNDSLMAEAIATHMAANGVKSVGFIAFNDAYGDGWLEEFSRAAAKAGITITNAEKFARTDTSVTGQVLKTLTAKPQAVLIAGAGTPAALPQKTLRERGFAGVIYQTHGIANNDFLRVGGKDVEGTILPAGPILVAAQLPDGSPIKKVALDYVTRYEAANGAGSVATFGAHAFDAMLMIESAIPAALAKGKPGTDAFHAGLRDGLESLKNATLTHGISTTSPTDHNGFDARARVMVTIRDGGWKLMN
jgi:branched-chain amino acid transport system substrate-binding protein